jgi:hypothetical protein
MDRDGLADAADAATGAERAGAATVVGALPDASGDGLERGEGAAIPVSGHHPILVSRPRLRRSPNVPGTPRDRTG